MRAYENRRPPRAPQRGLMTIVSTYVSELPIGEILVKAGLLSQSQVDEAVRESGTRQRLIGKTMVARGWLTKEQLQSTLEAQSLVRDGVVDVFRALKALSISCNFQKSFEDALQELDPLTHPLEQTCKLGEMLVEARILDRATLELAHAKSLQTGEPLGVVLVGNGVISESYLDAALELQVRVRDGMFSREQAIAALKQDPRRLLDMIAPHMKADESLTTRTKAAVRLGELFIRAGIVGQAAVSQALEISLARGQQIGEALVTKGFINHSQLDAALALQKMVTDQHLSVGEATACLVKVYTSNKPVSQCLLELNLLKGQPASKSPTISQPEPKLETKSSARKRIEHDATVTQLPAFNTYKDKLAGNPFINFAPDKSVAVPLSPVLGQSATVEQATIERAASAPTTIEPIQPIALDGTVTAPLPQAKAGEEKIVPIDLPTEEASKLSDEELSDLNLSEEEEIDYQSFFDAQFAYNNEDLKAFYKSLRNAYSRLGRVLLKRKQLLEAEDLLTQAFDISLAHKLTDKQPEDIMFLACLYIKQGKSWQSEKLLKLYLGKLEKETEPNDALLSLCHHRLALVYCHLSLLFKAEKHFKKAEEIIISSKQNQPSQRRLAAVLKDYAVLLKRMKRESEADKYYSQARKILSSSLLTG